MPAEPIAAPPPETDDEFAAPGETERYDIEPSRLEGEVTVSGAKNSVLRLMAATLLTAERVRLRNYPATQRDAQIHLGMLRALGKRHILRDGALIVEEAAPPPSTLVWNSRSIRNTLLILGALTARTGAGEVPLPGGCNLGGRKHDLHVMLLQRLGARITTTETTLRAEAPNGLVGAEISLPIRSTGATENALLCGSLARGRTVIWGPHVRPEILDLIEMLRAMGARIAVHGQERIEVTGVDALDGADHRVAPDNLEALSWVIAAAMTGGDVEVHGFPHADLVVPMIFLKASGVRHYISGDSVLVRGARCYPVDIATGPHPGVNSDMQPLFAAFGAMAQGESRIVDLRFPRRYGYAAELARMNVRVQTDGAMLRIHGAGRIDGAEVRAVDLRAGVALALAGFAATGRTRLHDAWQVERGYDRFVEKARALGARIEPR